MDQSTHRPRYPDLQVFVRTPNPLALVAGVREELRRAGASRGEITSFTEQALSEPADLERALAVAREWIGDADAA